MPRYWYDARAVRQDAIENNKSDEERDLNMRILADKKPYFMRYIYPTLMKQYNDYVRNTNTKCMRNFRMPIADLLAKDPAELSEEEATFLAYYWRRMPVSVNDCVMNRICRRFEAEFDGYLSRHNDDANFDPGFMKYGCEYTNRQYYDVAALYSQYEKRMKDYAVSTLLERNDDQFICFREATLRYFKEECLKVCNCGEQLCDIVIDACYRKAGMRRFAWDVCGDEIIANLLQKNGNRILYPVRDENGDFEYGGIRFRIAEKEVL